MEDVLVVADRDNWLAHWKGTIVQFEAVTPELLSKYRTILVAFLDVKYQDTALKMIAWKKEGLIGDSRLVMATYKGRHLWSPENDNLVERWVVHARSEREVLDSDRLAFVPLCLTQPRKVFSTGDDGFLFMGGRKLREPKVGLDAMVRSGHPGRVITDRAPAGEWPGVEILRERVPKKDYIDVLERARLFLVPLRDTPISHGHVDVITSILVGTPVLVTAGASCDDYVEHGVNGLLVKGLSVEAWVDAIHEGWERADEFRQAAKEMAPRYYSPKYAEYLRTLVSSLDEH
jgi:glycosyltransferase involved in cell wall biosynthesis